jgi:hypothetical protein
MFFIKLPNYGCCGHKKRSGAYGGGHIIIIDDGNNKKSQVFVCIVAFFYSSSSYLIMAWLIFPFSICKKEGKETSKMPDKDNTRV